MYCTHYIPSVLICICTINKDYYLIYPLDIEIISHLSYMLTLCIQFGVVPDNFRRGVLIPIPKKAECDTTEEKNWKLITVSSIFFKLLELYVLEECSSHKFSDF